MKGLFTQSFPGTTAAAVMGNIPVVRFGLRRRLGGRLFALISQMIHLQEGSFYTGTSGLVLPVPNKQFFPPEFRAGTRLTYYASLFNSIEINSSFYKIPQPATFSKWAGEVPDGFRFTVKLWRGITHEPALHFIPIDINKFLYAAGELGDKKGCLLVQLPPGTHAERLPQLERMLERIAVCNAGSGWTIAVEFRHRSWYRPETIELLKQYRAGLVLHDMPASKIDTPAGDTSFVYVRYHGVAGDYRGSYAEDLLQRDGERVKAWTDEGKDVYVYFNNTIGDALINTQTLRDYATASRQEDVGGR